MSLSLDTSLDSHPPAAVSNTSSNGSDGTPTIGTIEDESHQSMVHEFRRERKRSMVMADGWIDTQERTFYRWCKYQLNKRKLSIDNLKTGLSDGINLCHLVEILSKQSLPSKPHGTKNQIQRLDNLRIAFDFLEKTPGMHLVNIRPSDIEGGNIKIILGLVWSLINKYQIVDVAIAHEAKSPKYTIKSPKEPLVGDGGVNDSTPISASSSSSLSTSSMSGTTSATVLPAPAPGISSSIGITVPTSESSAKNDLLRWVNEQIEGYPGVQPVVDFTKSWQDGTVITALVDSLEGSEKKVLNVTGEALTDVTLACTKAESKYDIPILMEPGDIVSHPQDQALMTYISCFREYTMIRETEEPGSSPAPITPVSKTMTEKLESKLSPSGREDAAASYAQSKEGEEMAALAGETNGRVRIEVEQSPIASAIQEKSPPKSEASAKSAKASPAKNLLSVPEHADMEELVVPLSPGPVERLMSTDAVLGAVEDDDDAAMIGQPEGQRGEADSEASESESEEEKYGEEDERKEGTPQNENHQPEKLTIGILSPDDLSNQPARSRNNTHSSLVGAYIDPTSLEAAITLASPQQRRLSASFALSPQSAKARASLSQGQGQSPLLPKSPQAEAPSLPLTTNEPYDSETQAKLDALTASMDIDRTAVEMQLPTNEPPPRVVSPDDPTPVVETDEYGVKPDVHAFEDYKLSEAEDADALIPLSHESVQECIDRRIETLMNAIEICVVTPSQKYLQADFSGVVRAHEMNTVAATWTIVDGAGGWKFLRDYQSMYLAADRDGRVYTCKKKPECRFRIIRGSHQLFQDMHGHFLTVSPNGIIVRSEPKPSPEAKFKICFPVVEGVLKKKGSSGLMRWQERYFAFNGNVMSYWRQKKKVGKERPSGIYHPARMISVNINRRVAKRFNIVFQDGKIVELLAPTVEEAIRWVRGLNSLGIRTIQQSKRMSIFPSSIASPPVVANKTTTTNSATASATSSPAKLGTTATTPPSGVKAPSTAESTKTTPSGPASAATVVAPSTSSSAVNTTQPTSTSTTTPSLHVNTSTPTAASSTSTSTAAAVVSPSHKPPIPMRTGSVVTDMRNKSLTHQ